MDFEPLIEKRRARFAELEQAIASPTFYDDQKAASAGMKEHGRIRNLLDDWEALVSARRQLEQSRELAASGEDAEMAEMATEEIPGLEATIERLETAIQYALLPRDPTEDRDAIFEIRAGTGGDEASLFAGDLLRMYQRYAESIGFKIEMLEASPSEVGGFKEVTFRVTGSEVFRVLKYESGVHRVQRVPATETQGRIHTSTATVAVLPEAEEVDVEIRPEDLRIEVCRSGGAGGQHVNRTESAVQIFHLPSGLMVRCEEERSQMRNREKGMAILRAKLLAKKQQEEEEKYSSHRKSLIGSGGREEKIRTYNFPQNRITDHRIGLTLYNLDSVIEGDLGGFVDSLQASAMAERLADLEEGAHATG
ncbi:peptide chain release factor 1 [soil metagenome]